jgi:two-component system chemotaxis response regulator CheB
MMPATSATDAIEVLVIDDSAVVRQLLGALLAGEAGFHVTTASDPLVAMAKMRRHRPHVILLDMEMPRMDGLTFLKRIMATDPVPVVVCSGFAEPGTRLAVRALAAGAVDIVPKPRVSSAGAVEDNGLVDIVRAAAQARVGPPREIKTTGATLMPLVPQVRTYERKRVSTTPFGVSMPTRNRGVIAIGASTGGTEALREILCALPLDTPGILIVQHMPAGFTTAFSEHLNSVCALEVREAAPGDRVLPGQALVARGNRHMVLRRLGLDLVVDLTDDPPVSRHRPSVDVLFRSVAQVVGTNAVGVILTGMGNDGAEGLLALKRAGASTIAQDEATCVVFGMPKEAIDRGAVDVVLPLPKIAAGIVQRVQQGAGARETKAIR